MPTQHPPGLLQLLQVGTFLWSQPPPGGGHALLEAVATLEGCLFELQCLNLFLHIAVELQMGQGGGDSTSIDYWRATYMSEISGLDSWNDL